MLTRRDLLAGAAAATGLAGSARAAATEISSAIVCCLDFSSSMTRSELDWMLAGMRAVVQSPEFSRRIATTFHEQVALSMIWFADDVEPAPALPWTLLRADDDSVPRLGAHIQWMLDNLPAITAARTVTAGTDIANAVLHSIAMLTETVPWEPARRVIDVQSDGALASIPDAEAAREAAEALAIEVNAIVVGRHTMAEDALQQHYRDHLITTTGKTYTADSEAAMIEAWGVKILREIY